MRAQLTALAGAILLMSSAAHAAAPQKPDEASVRAVETGWNQAFMTGDGAALDALLDPDYVSVSSNGKAHSKADIIAGAKGYAAKNPGQKATALPPTSTVQIFGATALVRHHGASETSMDLFAFEHGRWVAKYSQHTAIPPAAAPAG